MDDHRCLAELSRRQRAIYEAHARKRRWRSRVDLWIVIAALSAFLIAIWFA